MDFAMMSTMLKAATLMAETAVEPVSIKNSAQNANAKLDTLTKSQMQE